jgi:phage FluMu gp28-like protein
VSLSIDIAADLDAVAFARERLGFEPDEKQAELLATTASQVIVNCTRQWGKSTVTAARAVYEAWLKAESLILVLSPSERQSGEFVRKARRFAARITSKVRGDGQNDCSVMLANGSRIVGVPSREDTIRGFSAVNLLLVDEASRVADELYDAVRPMLAVSNGATWLLSTPAGKRGFFWEEWAKGGADWKRVSVPATECPRIPAAFLERERRRAWKEDWFRQEYLCCFVESDECVFPRDLVERAFTDKVRPLFP